MSNNRLKPIPKNPEQISQENISPYLSDGGKAINQTQFSKNRGTEYSMKDDTVKDISIGLEDIDNSIMYYFNNVIKPNVIQNGKQIRVPVIYGSPERWKSVQLDGFYRDNKGKLMVPLIMFKRENIEKNRTLGNKLDGNTVHLYQVVGSKYNNRNSYDRFDIINNRIPSEQYYITATPDYITLTYSCVIFTDYIEQNNKLVEAINFASDSYWGDPNRYKFRASIDSFATTTILESGNERAAKSTFSIKVNGYIIPNTVNKDLATTRNKFYTKSQIIFTMETTENVKTIRTAGNTPKTSMGAAIGVVDSYNINITNNNNINTNTLIYLNTNKQITGNYINNTTINFNSGWLKAPDGIPSTSLDNFIFFCNGQFIEKNAIVSFNNNNNISTLIINPTILQYTFEETDEITAIGKFS